MMGRRTSEEVRDAIVARYRESEAHTLQSVGDEFGVCNVTVLNILKDRDIPRWKKGRTAKKGAESPNWKGGRNDNGEGYIKVHLNTEGGRRYKLEHRLVMEEHLGRELFPEETVHHINGQRDDNRIENLELWTSSHPPGQRVQDKVQWAREILALYDE